MAELKTRPTTAGIDDYIAAQESPQRREECRALVELHSAATGHPPVMWGPGIVGFDQYHYRYDSGRQGDFAAAGFASRKSGLVVYLMMDGDRQAERLQRLGRHRMGKSCLYIKRLSDVDLAVLEELVRAAYLQVKRTH